MRSAIQSLQHSESIAWFRKTLLRLLLLALLVCPSVVQAADDFESRTWTDRRGNQLTSAFVDAKNGEVQLKSEGKITKFKISDFSEPDQKYLRDLANYRRKQEAGEKPELPVDPAIASLAIQPKQTITEPTPDAPGYRKPLLDFPIRTWSDVTGKIKLQAKLVTAYNDKVVVLDTKGNVFDLAITKFSPDDQQYVATQLKGLQRDDLVNVLAKAATADPKQPGAANPPPAAVTSNDPAPLGTDDIKARLAQLNAQRQGNPDTNTEVAANTPPAQPELSTDDLKARLAALRQQKGEPEPEVIPAQPSRPVTSTPPPTPYTGAYPGHSMEDTYNRGIERANRSINEMNAKMAADHAQRQVLESRRMQEMQQRTSGSGSSSAYNTGYAAGRIVGRVIGVVLIFSFIVFVVKKFTG